MRQAGFYGKVAMRGDFVSRDLPQGLQQGWDQWLSQCVKTSQEQLAEAWLDHYLVSPLWRFALAPGLLAEGAVLGVMMPSVDRVGRYFPLTILLPLAAQEDLGQVLSLADSWFNAAEQTLLATLDADSEFEVFAQQVSELISPPECCTEHAWQQQGHGPARHPAYGRQALLANLATLALRDASLWWGQGSAQVPAGMLHVPGMPAAADFAAYWLGAPCAEEWLACR